MTRSFKAILLNGKTVTELDYPSVGHLPIEQVVDITIWVDSANVPPIRIVADPAKDETIHKFSRVLLEVIGNTGGHVVDVYEIRRKGETLARLYWPPNGMPILATGDIYFG